MDARITMNNINYTIYYTQKPGKPSIYPPVRDSGYMTNNINTAFIQAEITNTRYSDWKCFVGEWK